MEIQSIPHNPLLPASLYTAPVNVDRVQILQVHVHSPVCAAATEDSDAASDDTKEAETTEEPEETKAADAE